MGEKTIACLGLESSVGIIMAAQDGTIVKVDSFDDLPEEVRQELQEESVYDFDLKGRMRQFMYDYEPAFFLADNVKPVRPFKHERERITTFQRGSKRKK